MKQTLLAPLATGLGVVLLSAAAAAWISPTIALGVLAGGLWNLASLWCLLHLLDAWLGPRPSRKRAVAWLIAKFPLLYLAVVGLCYSSAISLLGFGLGFTVILVLAMGWFARQARQMQAVRS